MNGRIELPPIIFPLKQDIVSPLYISQNWIYGSELNTFIFIK